MTVTTAASEAKGPRDRRRALRALRKRAGLSLQEMADFVRTSIITT